MTETAHTVLVVDDNPWNRELITRRLQRHGYRVLEAEDGRQAVARVQSEPVDLLILDIMMPGMSGIEVLRALRRDFSAAELPIVMATAKNQSDDVVEALDLGANDYVTKPLDFPVVLARVQALLRTKAAAASVARPEGDPDLAAKSARPGLKLAGKYLLGEKLGAGNFGEVYRANHLGLEQPVAVKVLQTSVMASKEALSRFQREGASAFRLHHPNAVAVLDFGVTPGGIAFLVMQLLEGRSLEQEMRERIQFSPRRCGEIALPICDVLAEAHAMGIIHRDVKPANVFLHRTHRREVVKVLDFGIAKLVGDAVMGQSLTVEGGVLGTPAYMAPERLQDRDYDGRSDVYSLGVLIYKMLAGRGPFVTPNNEAMAVAIMHLTTEPEPLQRLCPELPMGLAELVMRTLRKDYRDRPTAAELADQLGSVLAASGLSPALREEPRAGERRAAEPRPAEPRPAETRPAAPPAATRRPAEPTTETGGLAALAGAGRPVAEDERPTATSPFSFGDLLGAPSPSVTPSPALELAAAADAGPTLIMPRRGPVGAPADED